MIILIKNDNGDENSMEIGESEMEICENQACNPMQVDQNDDHDDDDYEPPSKKCKSF